MNYPSDTRPVGRSRRAWCRLVLLIAMTASVPALAQEKTGPELTPFATASLNPGIDLRYRFRTAPIASDGTRGIPAARRADQV